MYDVDNDEAECNICTIGRNNNFRIRECPIINYPWRKKIYTDWICTECKMQVDDEKDISNGSVCLDRIIFIHLRIARHPLSTPALPPSVLNGRIHRRPCRWYLSCHPHYHHRRRRRSREISLLVEMPAMD